MTDRELLEKAARAAGLQEWGWMADTLTHVVNDQFVFWEPLTDDGDALRLEAALLIDTRWFKNSVKASALPDSGEWLAMASEVFNENSDTSTKSAAKRRAIVRAAAAIEDSTAEKE
jgi:hypothetical protein